MFDGPSVAAALKSCGVTHVVWIPDSYLGTWENTLAADPDIKLVRVCREGEAIGVAAGLLLGGKQPIVIIQCTGFFEAGDALRNVVHDMRLPLFLVIGVRSQYAHMKKATDDNCPVFTEPLVRAWDLPFVSIDPQRQPASELAEAYRKARAENRAMAVLLPE